MVCIEKTIIIVPTYNEANNIEILVKDLKNRHPSFTILVVDDNSPDGTHQRIESLKKQYDSLELIKRPSKLGLGSAYIEGFKYALAHDFQVIIQMDADFSHSPQYLTPMKELLSECDLVIGSRYVQGGGISRWNPARLFLSRAANMFTKLLLGSSIRDATSGFKCFRASVLERIDFTSIASEGYVFQIEMVHRATRCGLQIKEYPIIFQGRVKEKSKMSLAVALEAFFRVICLSLSRTHK